jgi:hypothetical protein
LNPDHFKGRSITDTLSTLVHEMAHVWQHAHGKPTRNGYHNKEWAAKMDSLGLNPSSTGAPGGKRTGQSVSHYIAAGGPFAVACSELLAGDGQERAPGQIRLRRLRRGRVGQGGPEPRLRRLRGGHGADRIDP